jgi:hypothetical protein
MPSLGCFAEHHYFIEELFHLVISMLFSGCGGGFLLSRAPLSGQNGENSSVLRP